MKNRRRSARRPSPVYAFGSPFADAMLNLALLMAGTVALVAAACVVAGGF